MFRIDDFNNLEPLEIYISNPAGQLIYPINEYVDEETASLKIGLNQQYELSLDVKYNIGAPCGEYLQEGMYLVVEKVGLFKLRQPQCESDGVTEVKSVTAFSCDVELEDKNCRLEINMGTETSQEYLVAYDEDETELLVNPYTNIPYDWIVIHNKFPEQLDIFKNKYYPNNVCQEINILVNDSSSAGMLEEVQNILNLIPRLKHKFNTGEEGILQLVEYVIFNYDESTGELLSITLTDEFLNRIDELIVFYTKYHDQLSLIPLVLEKTEGNWTIGEVYGVGDDDYNLANMKCQFDIDENIYSFLTQTFAKSTECISRFDIFNRKVDIIPVENIGEDTGIIYSYDNLMNTMGISADEENLCTRVYVTGADDLGIEQVNFGRSYVDNVNYKLNAKDSSGNRIYVSDDLASKYAAYDSLMESKREDYINLTKLYNRYSEQIDEIKYRVPNDDLKTDWSTFTKEELEGSLANFKNLLVTLITLYREDYGELGLNQDDSVNEEFIKNTIYWHDYKAYKEIITEIDCAINVFPYYSQQDKWTIEQLDTYKNAISAWETEWSLYGTIELQAKIDSYTQNMNILSETAVIKIPPDLDDLDYIPDSIYKWEDLSSKDKAEFNNQEINYQYDVYMEMFNLRQSAIEYINMLYSEINDLEDRRSGAQQERSKILTDVSIESNFTEDERKLLNLLIKESEYQNENIVVTSIDGYDDKIDKMLELLADGKEKASIYSRPQLTFTIGSDNVFGLYEFRHFWEGFCVGNYITSQYRDDIYIKLRLIEYRFNPCLPSSSDFDLTFSNFIRSNSSISDIASILGDSTSSSSGSGSGKSSGSTGAYGESDDIDITISNTMLSKLLNSELFGSRVKNVILDTIDANMITAKITKTGKIVSGNYTVEDGKGALENKTGSIIELENGTFNFGGGSLRWDGDKLRVRGDVSVREEFDSAGRLLNGIYLGESDAPPPVEKDTITGNYVEDVSFKVNFGTDGGIYNGEVTDYENPYDLLEVNKSESEIIGHLFHPESSAKDRRITFYLNGIDQITEALEITATVQFLVDNSNSTGGNYVGGYFSERLDLSDIFINNTDQTISKNGDQNALYLSIRESIREELYNYVIDNNITNSAGTTLLKDVIDAGGVFRISYVRLTITIPKGTPTSYVYCSDLNEDEFKSDFTANVMQQIYGTRTPSISDAMRVTWEKLPIWKKMRERYSMSGNSFLSAVQNGKLVFAISEDNLFCKNIISHDSLTLEAPDIALYGNLVSTQIPAGTNFDEITDCGFYVGVTTLGDGSTPNYQNAPAYLNGSFALEVLHTGSTTQLMQRITYCSKGHSRKWERHFHSGAWGAWYCTYADRNTILWSGAEQMEENKVIPLAEPISVQPTGVVLVFSYNSVDNVAQEYQYQTFFISKQEVTLRPGVGHQFMLCSSSFGNMATKYLYVNDTQITGNEKNIETGTSVNTGIKFDNNRYVLRNVIGV